MSAPIDMPALIAAMEAATGPDRALDEAIDLLAYERGWRPVRCATPDRTPAYTASLDASKRLVPEGWPWHAGRHETGCGHAYMHNGEPHFAGAAAAPNPKRRHAEVRAATPELSLCIASLRARMDDAT